MNTERFFIWALSATYIVYSIIRIKHYWNARNNDQIEIDYSKTDILLLRLFIGIEFILIVLFIFQNKYFEFAKVEIAFEFRVFGIILCAISLYLFDKIHKYLGKNFSNTLRIKKNHKLVTSGPYKFVRHPMYATYYLYNIGIFLITANLLIGGLWLFFLTIIVLYRINKEENMLIEKFGVAYKNYKATTGAFFPKFLR